MLRTNEIDSYRSNEIIAGLTYGEWTARWWQWALSIPANVNPLVDLTGQHASLNQPKEVWFLSGIFGETNVTKPFPHRVCKVPANTPILIPVINCEADKIEYPHLKTDQEILEHVLKQADSIVRKNCSINGELLPLERVSSDPKIFDVKVHPNFNKFNIGNGESHASADGYWVFLKGLTIGKYELQFDGACEHGSIQSGATYSLTVL